MEGVEGGVRSTDVVKGGIRILSVWHGACKLKFVDFKGASLDTEFAMHGGKDNVKILFLQGQAYMAFNACDAVVDT
ncbi:hypothetical protein C5167_034554 [Papaver somniferum]|uniref:Uncharacterized protein n=1 Tax=Papaver somniferum TaxID=3469 RepID=A0A4Y7KHB9_PAPSO|nr:hypothetical protein C5167_034554 [Papaver somniferum]